MKFPEKIYSVEDLKLARELVEKGFKHKIEIIGEESFVNRVKETFKLLETAGYMDFVRSYIRRIEEKGGFSQLRESELTIWANKYTVSDLVEAASLWVQKAEQVRLFLNGIAHYSGDAEEAAIKKRIDFLKKLMRKTEDPKIKRKCREKLRMWFEGSLLY